MFAFFSLIARIFEFLDNNLGPKFDRWPKKTIDPRKGSLFERFLNWLGVWDYRSDKTSGCEVIWAVFGKVYSASPNNPLLKIIRLVRHIFVLVCAFIVWNIEILPATLYWSERLNQSPIVIGIVILLAAPVISFLVSTLVSLLFVVSVHACPIIILKPSEK